MLSVLSLLEFLLNITVLQFSISTIFELFTIMFNSNSSLLAGTSSRVPSSSSEDEEVARIVAERKTEFLARQEANAVRRMLLVEAEKLSSAAQDAAVKSAFLKARLDGNEELRAMEAQPATSGRCRFTPYGGESRQSIEYGWPW